MIRRLTGYAGLFITAAAAVVFTAAGALTLLAALVSPKAAIGQGILCLVIAAICLVLTAAFSALVRTRRRSIRR